jgi:purine nucleosidase
MPEAIPVLLDTDPGSDIDDVVALAYLLRQPRCRLVGITTVSGKTELRAGIVDYLLRLAGRTDIPVHAGLHGPLRGGSGQPEVPHYPAIAALPHRIDFPRSAAIDFLRNTIRAHPGQITLLTIGPLTNLAVLFSLEPELATKIKRVVTMGGRFFPPAGWSKWAEWNILCDPTAAAMFYDTRFPGGHTSFGLDVTTQCTLPSADVHSRFSSHPLLAGLLDMAEVWFKHADLLTFHDPLAAVSIFHPEICSYKTGTIHLEPSADTEHAARTYFTTSLDSAGPHTVAHSVDPAAFLHHYFQLFQ